ncbi:MAG: zinc ribbon domain-containing protein [Pseudomonadota bacterium]|nr:zinc ribbon domain-containing protein [Pseudomonadota bacterium]
MPIYEYKCQVCGSIFEIFQKISDGKLEKMACQTCGKTTNVEKLVSSSGFRLKGSGWYATDFKNNKKKERSVGKDQTKANKEQAKSLK